MLAGWSTRASGVLVMADEASRTAVIRRSEGTKSDGQGYGWATWGFVHLAVVIRCERVS